MDRKFQTCVNLKLNRNLINSKFDGYKLSLDTVPVTKISLDAGIEVVKPTEEQYSYHFAKLFSNHNCLFSDPWDERTIYFVDKSRRINQLKVATIGQLESCEHVFQIPDREQNIQVPGRYASSLKFPSEQLAVLANGCGQIFLLDTGKRSSSHADWQVLFRSSMLETNQPSVVFDAVCCTVGSSTKVHVLLAYVEETEAETKSKYYSSFITNLNWITLSKDNDGKWEKTRTRRLVGRKPFDYAALRRNGEGVVIASENPYTMTYDTERPITEDLETIGESDRASAAEYVWSQNSEELCVQFLRNSSISKTDICFKLTSDHIEFGVKNGTNFLNGDLEGIVDVDSSTWTMNDQIIELFLCKAGRSTWSSVVVGDDRGELIDEASDVEEAYQRLAHLTSDKLNPDPDTTDHPYNAQELEACDECTGDGTILQIIDGEDHKVTHQMNLGSNQWLFNVSHDQNKSLGICLRHDVDGILWELKNDIKPQENPFEHHGTFNAFGYVQASKQQKRYSSCSPDMSYSVICDCVRHIYIYRQSVNVMSPLKNRKTGKNVMAVAKQQVISLESVDDIIGLSVRNDHMFITTSNCVHVAKVNINES